MQPETARPQLRTQTALCTSYGLKQLVQTEELVQVLQLSEQEMQEPNDRVYPLTQPVQVEEEEQVEQGERHWPATVTPD